MDEIPTHSTGAGLLWGKKGLHVLNCSARRAVSGSQWIITPGPGPDSRGVLEHATRPIHRRSSKPPAEDGVASRSLRSSHVAVSRGEWRFKSRISGLGCLPRLMLNLAE